MAEAPTYDVYLSYSRADSDVVEELRRRLEASGLRVWLDVTALEPGTAWAEEMAAALDQARIAIFCVGAAGMRPGQLGELEAAEARAARDPDFRFFAVLLPGVPSDFPVSALPVQLASRQWLDLRAGLDDESAWSQLVETLAASPSRTDDRPPASESVKRAAASLTGDVSAGAFVTALLQLHPEYGERRGAEVRLEIERGERASAEEWLRRVRALLDPNEAKELHGRLLIMGLARLDAALGQELERGGFLGALEREIFEPLAKLFADAPAPPEETVPTHTDNPALVDALNREGFARILARRIRDMRTKEIEAAAVSGDTTFPRGRSFLVHIHGPWGIGKTSLLNFLRDDLHQSAPKPWVVVSFNAWQHQRLLPPWWWLMSAVYHQGFSELWRIAPLRALLFRGREWLWRAKGGWQGYLMLVAGATFVVLIWRAGFFDSLGAGEALSLETAKGLIVGIAAVLTPLLAIWGVARSASRWLLTTSARGARVVLDNSRDPMQTVKEHFAELVDWLGYSLVILIDDLDRCKAPYVVETLEGVQTLFRDVPVAYVIAADRDWLADSYASEYGSFGSVGDEAGRPLGFLFLEKTFQMTLSVPTMAEATRDGYWRHLIRPATTDDRTGLRSARVAAERSFAALQTEEAVRKELAENPGTTPVEQRARLEAAAIQLAAPMLERSAEHVLQPFRPLLDANPRAMKRLVNAYGLARGIELLSRHNLGGEKQAQHRTALWTILSLRWPRLADYLAAHPDAAEDLAKGIVPARVPLDISPLFEDERVKAVVRGDADGVQTRLDPTAVRLSVSA